MNANFGPLIYQKVTQRCEYFYKNCPEDMKQKNLKYLDMVLWCIDELKKMLDQEKKRFIANSLLVVTRIVEVYNKNVDGINRFDSNHIDVHQEFAPFINNLMLAIQKGFILNEFQIQDLDVRQISPERNQFLKINGKPHQSGEFYEIYFGEHQEIINGSVFTKLDQNYYKKQME